jgi:hypothetical protein
MRKNCLSGGLLSRQSNLSSSELIANENLLPDGRMTLDGSFEKNAGLAENEEARKAPMNIPNGVPVIRRIIAVDS